MKIAILSSYSYVCKVNNYGSILQYFALQTYLRQLGHKPFWIRYVPYKKKPTGLNKCLREKILKSNFNLEEIKHYNTIGFRTFIEKHLCLSDNIYHTYKELKSNPPKADLYIVGSDQVWNGFSPDRYLMFIPKTTPKISYAASFGRSSIQFYLKPLLWFYLKKFKAISIREIDGEKICRDVGRNDAKYVIDPSFLLSKQEYEKIIDKENIPIIYEDYIFGYFVNPFKDDIFPLQDEIEKLTEDCKCKLIITAIQNAEKSFSNNEKISPSPLEWLQLIRKAKYVITNSFHGVAYSIIFRKQFLLIPQDGSMSNQNCRYINLLEKLKLTNRIYNPYKHSIKTQLEENINWEQVATEENDFIAISKTFLKQQIHQMT